MVKSILALSLLSCLGWAYASSPGFWFTSRQVNDPVRLTRLEPPSAGVDQEVTVTIEATVTPAPDLLPASVTLLRYNSENDFEASLGQMFDDGTHGDRLPSDNIFTTQVITKEATPKIISFRASVAYRGQLKRTLTSLVAFPITQRPGPVLQVQITKPLGGTVFNALPISVEGTVTNASDQTQVVVNGIPALVTNGRFIVNNLPLSRDGHHIVTAIAFNPNGETSQASTNIALDTLPPTIYIDSPTNDFTTSDDTIAITGIVSDVITGQPQVIINGVSASVNNGSFIGMGIALTLGANQIVVTARDGVGNIATTKLTVNRVATRGLTLNIVSGQAQSGVVNFSLPDALAVQLVNIDNEPIANREITFSVARGDGALRIQPSQSNSPPRRTLVLMTDGNGRASAYFTLGSRSGAGNNRVKVSATGGLASAEFCATALSGTPDHLAIIPMSNQQTGVVNQPLADPFVCAVLDTLGNPVSEIPVIFQVVKGNGNFNGSKKFTIKTGADGIARALLTLGGEQGIQNHVVAAKFEKMAGAPVIFTASGRIPGLISNTSFRGIVLDNGDRPLRNAKAIIEGTNRQVATDELGRFVITDVPPGPQRLFIDGSAIGDAGKRIFPNLEFEVNVISGVENTLPFPIYLPPLATDSKSVRTITGTVTEPIALQMPGVPEATLTLLPGTIVSNSNGPASPINPITVRFSRVNNDRVPMPPPNGSMFMIAATVQPAGTHFSPPAKICVPNAGMSPGAQVDIFSFDHDVGQFLSIGLATVNEDGSMLCSNPGFGISKAGWAGCVPPAPRTTTVEKPFLTFLTQQPITVCVDEMSAIEALASPPGGMFTWKSENESILKIGRTSSTDLELGGGITGKAEVSGEKTGITKVTVKYKATPNAKEITQTAEVRVVRMLEAQAKRADEPDEMFSSEPGIFCVGDTVTGRLLSEPQIEVGAPIKWELKSTDGDSPKVIDYGVGGSVSHKFSEKGSFTLIFYCDANDNGKFDGDEGETYVQTITFNIHETVIQLITVARHIDVPFTDANIDERLAIANILLRRRDRVNLIDKDLDDTRCCIELKRLGAITTFGVPGSPPGTPPSLVILPEDYLAVHLVPSDVKVVLGLKGRHAGAAAIINGRFSIILEAKLTGTTWAHEFGHTQGIVGDYQDEIKNHRIMFFEIRPGQSTLSTDEREFYRKKRNN